MESELQKLSCRRLTASMHITMRIYPPRLIKYEDEELEICAIQITTDVSVRSCKLPTGLLWAVTLVSRSDETIMQSNN